MMDQVFYSRANDGRATGPLVVQPLAGGKYQVGQGHKSQIYASKRQLLIGLTGHPEARHWTFDRYFRQGKYALETPDSFGALSPIMDLFGCAALTVNPAAPLLRGGLVSPTLVTVAPVSPPSPMGIDLRNRSGEVAKLLFAGFGRRIYSMGYDPEDVLQEVYKGLLIRNRGKCPWDITKSSFGHYVHMVAGCILSNYQRRQQRIRSMEQVGMLGYGDDGDLKSVDAADACASRVECASYLDTTDMVDKDFIAYLTARLPPGQTIVFQVLPLAIDGLGRHEIAGVLDVSVGGVAKALKTIRTVMSDWAMTPFLN